MPLSWSTIPHCQNRPSLSKGTRLTSQDIRPSPSFISRSWLWRWTGGNADLEQIVLRFSGRAAQLVREQNWHSSQQIQELADGNLELSLTLNSLEEIIPWILSWGKNCEVVRPAKLRKKVKIFALFPHKIE